ncbi:shikimate kinase [Candidatus Uabimicrobium amorphum]|uniref:Shikimate kinase n=1 Tax=Uabimicrobium amorphum TaxID=2596890 RepID=A0A5S9IU41_UABAM|nr:shikimate kinase [Candidatus Uabimicrobium amorphum]BBM88183.1 shikimate kinase [Candidatus Uabimicrobium amorphum]
MQSNNIFLIGMMGAGKSTVGKIVAQRLEYDFVDMDVYIEQQANMSIPEIFETHGEKHFRTLEEKALAAIVREKEKSCVIATGGGCILSGKNRELMAKTGTRVFLQVDIDTLHTRLSKCYARPLAKSKAQMQEMYNERYKFYCDCDCIIDADDLLQTVVDKIVEFIN